MSVLLEALKKAAEEKKKQAGETHHEAVEPMVMVPSAQENFENTVSDSVSATIDADNDSGFEEPLSLKFNFEVDQPQPLDSVHATQEAIVSQEVVNDAADFVTPAEIAEIPVLGRSDEMVVSEDKVLQESHKQSTAKEAGTFRLQGATQPKPAVSDDLETRLAVSEFDSNGSSSVADIKDDETDFSDSIEASAKDESETDIPDSWESLRSQSLPGDKVDKDSEPEASVKVIGSQEKPVSTNEGQEHDWSLEQIPGYQRYGAIESQQKKTRLILPHLISKKSHLPSKWRFYFFSGSLVLLGLAYYAMLYFDQQSSVIDSDLQRYQVLSKSRIAEPTSPLRADLPAKNMLSSSQMEEKQTDVTQPEPPSSKVIESTKMEGQVKTEVHKVKADKAPSVTQKPVGQKKHELTTQSLPKQVSPKMTIISREQESAVSMGFKAYQRSDWQAARRYYEQAYEEEPNSLPALFGLGAVAVQLGEQNKAVIYYQKVLALEPGNQLAQKAILSIQSLGNSNQQTIDELKTLEEASPNDPEITFALGNAYAKRKDWVTAQSYYFKAYQYDSEQPIYVLNLAVSLDQLGEYRLAKKYYDEALAKASISAPAFNADSIKKRLVVLNQFLSGEH